MSGTVDPHIAPASDLDLFSDAHLNDPYPAYEALRALGPVVRLSRHDVWAVTGHDDVRHVLTDPETFSSVDGIALTEEANTRFLGGTVLATDGAAHARLRRPLSRALNPRAMREITSWIETHAAAVADRAVVQRRFDAVELAQELVTDIVLYLMGLPETTRSRLVEGAAATFDCFGPDNARYRAANPIAVSVIAFLSQEVTRDTVRPGSWMAALYRAADEGQIDEADVVPLMSAYVTAGMDTTIYALGGALQLLSTHPAQWERLRSGEVDGDDVFHETLRLEAPIQAFGRRVARETELGGVPLQPGEQVWLLYGAAGRDPARWGADADRFDAARAGTEDQLSLGAGPHLCAGNHLAALQARALVESLAARCAELRPAGEPVRVLNNLLRGWSSVPLEVTV